MVAAVALCCGFGLSFCCCCCSLQQLPVASAATVAGAWVGGAGAGTGTRGRVGMPGRVSEFGEVRRRGGVGSELRKGHGHGGIWWMEATGSASEVEVLEGVKSLSSSSWTSGREKSRKFPAVVVSGSRERLAEGRGGEGAAVSTLRGGGMGGRPWFTGYEDTTDEGEKDGEYDGSEYDQEEEERVETETGEEEGEGGEERARRSEDRGAVGESEGDDRRGDVGGGRGTTRTTGDDEGREAHEGGGVDGNQEAGSSSADEGGWGSRRGGSTLGERR